MFISLPKEEEMTAENKTEDQSLELKRFLNISGIIEFVYEAASDKITVFKFTPEKEIMYEGELDKWDINVRLSGTEAAPKQMEAFYKALREKRKESVSFLDLISGRYTVSFRTYPAEDDKSYGVLIPSGQELAGNVIPEYRRSSDKDAMLDMLNKRAINDYAQKVCARRDCPSTYIIIFDLDNFKVVNDSFGHMFGDNVLHTVTAIINNVIGEHGLVGRVGGDEIMIVTKDIHSKTELRPFMRDIRISVEEQFKDKLGGISLTCSMGAAAYPDHGNTCSKVMDIADKMLYLAKEKGRNRYIIYTPEMHAEFVENFNNGETESIKNIIAKNFDKIGIIHYMMEDYLKKGTSSNDSAFANVGQAFKLKEILIVYDKGKVGFKWTENGSALENKDLRWMELDNKFYSKFDNDGLLIVDGLYLLGEDMEFLKNKLMKRDAESALFYRFSFFEDYQGYVMFVKKGQRQKWSEYEILALSTIGKIFELSIQDAH